MVRAASYGGSNRRDGSGNRHVVRLALGIPFRHRAGTEFQWLTRMCLGLPAGGDLDSVHHVGSFPSVGNEE